MNDLERNIVECLQMFGPSDLRTIQAKLDLRGLVKSQNEIDTACNRLVQSKLIKEATGFSDIAYKV